MKTKKNIFFSRMAAERRHTADAPLDTNRPYCLTTRAVEVPVLVRRTTM